MTSKGFMVITWCFALIFVMIAGAGSSLALESALQASGPRHTLSEIVDSSSNWEKVVDTCHGFAEGINFDRSGQLWMVGVASGELFKVEDGKCVTVGDVQSSPNGAKFHKDGRLFVTDRLLGLMEVDTKTGVRKLIVDSYENKKFRGVNDLVFDEKGGLYFTDAAGSSALEPIGRVFYLPSGPDAKVELFADKLAYPNGIALSSNGQRVYIAEFDKKRVISKPSKNAKKSPETAFVFCRLEGGIGPDGMTVDSDGNLYVAEFFAGEIVIFDGDGFKYGALRMPKEAGTMVTNLAIHEGSLYVTEGMKNEVWRIKIKKTKAPLFGDL